MPTSHIHKGLSMPGQFLHDHNDYLDWRGDAQALGIKAARLMIQWKRMQPTGFGTWEETFRYHAANPGPWAYWDDVIAAANADGAAWGGSQLLWVILTLDSAYPYFSNGTPTNYAPDGTCNWRDPATCTGPSDQGKGPETKFPDDVSTTSPWAHWVNYLLCRYKYGVAPNPTGPTPDGQIYGNPKGAYIHFLEVCNEPNRQMWPLSNCACKVATMMQTATVTSAANGNAFILGPGTSDGDGDNPKQQDWDAFTRSVLAVLQNWTPPWPLFWSHHNYSDIKQTTTNRVGLVRDYQNQFNFKGAGADRSIFLTEGGFDMNPSIAANEGTQAAKIDNVYTQLTLMPSVKLWCNHIINNVNVNSGFWSGLRNFYDPITGTRAPLQSYYKVQNMATTP
jgi:hypothetical protein